ncbi:hypothetical protein [Lutibacter sp.]|uniref:hypothetical protein n=1 Tax=Lutibacter sp. TaxID=1925666 RepID=UPI0027332C4A|nr:hypothetical protein [Lutibacter sp.]MDP3312540.1 hypothetical protein [Lutibacter sp.]
MKNQLFIVCIALFCVSLSNYGQSNQEEKKYGVIWSGFVKTDFMFDTRQTVNAREGHFMILPAKENVVGGNDLNDQSSFNILSIQTRLKASISGPDFFGMKTSGAIEAAFFGNTDASVGELRLRHAFVALSNDMVEILVGQYWHPMFVTSVFPSVYSFNTGVPFQPFSRNPQLRITTKGKVKFIGALFTERDFQTRGASVSLSGIPQLHAQLQFGSASSTLGGFGVNLKTQRPALGTDNFTSTAFIGYFRTNVGKVTWKAEAVYGQNMSDVLQISGFGTTTNGDFINNDTFSMWTELNGDITETMEWGLFGGYSKNSGFGESVSFVNGFLGNNVENAMRIAPRIGWKSGKLTIGVEGEYTKAQYGSINSSGDISSKGIDRVSNFRLLTTAIYNF